MKDIILILIIVTIIVLIVGKRIKKFHKQLKTNNICDPNCNSSCDNCPYHVDNKTDKNFNNQ